MAKRRGMKNKIGRPSREYESEKEAVRDRGTVHTSLLPAFLLDNEFLVQHHRPQLHSVVACFKSIFKMHSETWNIWTHLAGFVVVAILSAYYLVVRSQSWHERLSFAVFFAGALFCMAASTTYHTLVCHSETLSRTLARLDYCGIVVLIVSSFAPWVHFAFYCNGLMKSIYLGSVLVLGVMCLFVVVADRFRGADYRKLRAVLFIGLGLTGVVPGLHYILSHDWSHFGFYFWLLFMATLYIAGGVIYASRVPECFSPGKFDIWFHSHQIMHLCVLGGMFTCYYGASKLAHYRMTSTMECTIDGLL